MREMRDTVAPGLPMAGNPHQGRRMDGSQHQLIRLVPSYRGQKLDGRPLDGEDPEIGILIGDKKPGPFSREVDRIKSEVDKCRHRTRLRRKSSSSERPENNSGANRVPQGWWHDEIVGQQRLPPHGSETLPLNHAKTQPSSPGTPEGQIRINPIVSRLSRNGRCTGFWEPIPIPRISPMDPLGTVLRSPPMRQTETPVRIRSKKPWHRPAPAAWRKKSTSKGRRFYELGARVARQRRNIRANRQFCPNEGDFIATTARTAASNTAPCARPSPQHGSGNPAPPAEAAVPTATTSSSAVCSCANGLFSGLGPLDRHLPRLLHRPRFSACSAAWCSPRTAAPATQRPPGELGKTIGLDRVPSAHPAGKKTAAWSAHCKPMKWNCASFNWMEKTPPKRVTSISTVMFVSIMQ